MKKGKLEISDEMKKARLKLSIEHYIKYFIGKRTCEVTKEEALYAISLAVREFAMDEMYNTMARYNEKSAKRVYYLSIEYLIGRSLENNLHNLGLYDLLKDIKIDGFPDISMEEIFDTEYDPALGNGGLGWLPAIWTRWRRSAFRDLAMGLIISSGCLSKNLKTAGRWNRPTTGFPTFHLGNWLARTDR